MKYSIICPIVGFVLYSALVITGVWLSGWEVERGTTLVWIYIFAVIFSIFAIVISWMIGDGIDDKIKELEERR